MRQAPNGYWYTKCESSWRLTHHLTAEKKLGRPLREDERVHFKSGFTREDYDNPNAIEVVLQGKSSARRRLAQIEARIEDLQLEAEELRKELGAHADPTQPIKAELHYGLSRD